MDPGDKTITEIRDRLRRIETRFTRYMHDRGFETGVDRPRLMPGGFISAPTPDCRVKDLLDAIPGRLAGVPVDVFVGADHIATITKGANYG